ncbi:hypothetical protein LQ384_28015 [Rhodococcus rhodochrous]|uniref:Uncharacterized protein n=1 Tax=Rhodococcus rhodochrous TaxID=1829 RepID=A0AAW4XR62_RHORH|nr:hypothetical protein [Rhodococcus rhodochrous]MCD2114932.1 hypothetical protein [Rhodococcus rhodochrous]
MHSARTGARQDAAGALHELVAMLDRGQRIDGMAIAPARLSGLSPATSPTLTRADHLPIAAPLRPAGRS